MTTKSTTNSSNHVGHASNRNYEGGGKLVMVFVRGDGDGQQQLAKL
jgi:hypothetical protein